MTVVAPVSYVSPASASLVAPLVAPVAPLVAPLVAPPAPATEARGRARSRRTTSRVATPIVLDLVAGLLGLSVAALVTGGLPLEVSAVLVVLWLLVSYGTRAPSGVEAPPALSPGSAPVALRAGMLLGVLSWTASTLAPTLASQVATDQALLAFVASATVLACGVDLLHRRVRRAGATRVVLVGGPEAVATMLAELDRTPGHGLEVAAACVCSEVVTDPQLGQTSGLAVTWGLAELPGVLAENVHDAVLALPGPGLAPRELRALGWRLEALDTPLLVGTGLVGTAPRRTTPARAGDIGLMHLRPVRRQGSGRLAKHAWERVAAALALLALGPVLLALALAVRRDSPGPAVFQQTRVGRDGRTFVMLKLRTMTVGSEHLVAALRDEHGVDQMLFKLADDPRVTPLGRWLRRYSLDELPQLLNVVRGQMSLVGPRPALPGEVQAYDDYPRRRLSVRPGLTGLWQISGRSELSFDDAVRLDLDYVDNWTLARDLGIVARTLGAVLGHRGAY